MVNIFNKFNKSQISLFVIIAIIIVSLGLYYFSFNSGSISIFTDQSSSYKVKQYVQSCLDIQTTEAINKIGLHSGWLYSPPLNYINKDSNEKLIKTARGFDFFNIKIPYWYYYNDAQKSFEFNIPEFNSNNKYSIRNQIKRYIDENLEKNCIRRFSNFKDIYKIDYFPKEMKSKVLFKNDKIKVELSLPLKIIEINKNNSEFINYFEIEKDNKLIVPYNLAKDIVISESKSSFVEKRMLQFLTPYMSINGRDLLPPFYDFKIGFDFQPWKVSKVKKLVKQIISSSINLIQFYGTNTKSFNLPKGLEDNQFAQGVYGLYNKDYLSENSIVKKDNPKIFSQYKDYNIKTNFEYFYPMSFKLSPSLGNQILLPKPKAAISILPIFFTTYTAVYEMTSPILFQILDSKNKNDKFKFNLAIETNIDHNSPLKENVNFNFDINSLPKSTKSLICDTSQFISKDVFLDISDPIQKGKRTNPNNPIKGIDDALVSFNCKGIATCYVGQTKINGLSISKNLTRLKFKLPINCAPGKLEVYKFGYTKLSINNVNPNLNNEINLGEKIMYSQKEVNLKLNILSSFDSKYANGRSLNKYEKGFLIMENLENNDLTQIVEFTKKNQNDLKIKLVPGNYSIESFLIYENNISIADSTFCYNKGLFSGSKCQIIPGFTAKSWVTGSLEIPKFEVNFNDLFYNNKLILNIIDMPIPTRYDDLENMIVDIKTASYSKKPYFDKN